MTDATLDVICVLPPKKTARSRREVVDAMVRQMQPFDAHRNLKKVEVACFCLGHPGTTANCQVCKGTGISQIMQNPNAKWQYYKSNPDFAGTVTGRWHATPHLGAEDLFLCSDLFTEELVRGNPVDDYQFPDAVVTPDGLWVEPAYDIIRNWKAYRGLICVVLLVHR